MCYAVKPQPACNTCATSVTGWSTLTVSRASPGSVGLSAATDAMSPPITCTAGCSGPAWLANSFTMLSTEVAIDAISGIGIACCLHLLLDRFETSVLLQDRWLVPKRALLLVWHCIFFSHNPLYNKEHSSITIKSL